MKRIEIHSQPASIASPDLKGLPRMPQRRQRTIPRDNDATMSTADGLRKHSTRVSTEVWPDLLQPRSLSSSTLPATFALAEVGKIIDSRT